jgi:Kef-type K+ transport system membrane component KefB
MAGKRRVFLAVVVCLVMTRSALAANADEAAARVMEALALILAASALVHDLCARMGQPVVMGEMLAGFLLRNLPILSPTLIEQLIHDVPLAILAQLGLVLMLFEIGIESTVGEVMEVLSSAVKVAVLGAAASFGLGWIVASWLMPSSSPLAKLFIAGAITTTSAGVPARIISDAGCSRLPESRLILSAAVIDDILGLVLLALATQSLRDPGSGTFDQILVVVFKAFAFLLISTTLGLKLVPRLFRAAYRLRGENVLLATALSLCFGMSYLAYLAGLAPIVGAYVAGLVIEEAHNSPFVARGERRLQELTGPLSSLFTPVFFLLVGMQGVHQADRLAVGFGMVPRGEVSLIFVALGNGLTGPGAPLIPPTAYSAVVLTVMATCLLSAPALKWRLKKLTAAP